MNKLVFLLEEQSMQEAMRGVLPRLLPEHIAWQCIPHEGKQDLERSVPRKLRAWREPDRLESPFRELKEIVPAYQKVSGARSIAPHLDLERNRSRSFRVFVQGIRRLVTQWDA